MTDKFDAMTDEQVVAKTLAMLGYVRLDDIPYFWQKGKKGWSDGDALGEEGKHAFAAEVKGHMIRKRWGCNDLLQREEDEPNEVIFYGYLHEGTQEMICLLGCAEYDDMDAHPRAVCIAALRAKAAEKESEHSDGPSNHTH